MNTLKKLLQQLFPEEPTKMTAFLINNYLQGIHNAINLESTHVSKSLSYSKWKRRSMEKLLGWLHASGIWLCDSWQEGFMQDSCRIQQKFWRPERRQQIATNEYTHVICLSYKLILSSIVCKRTERTKNCWESKLWTVPNKQLSRGFAFRAYRKLAIIASIYSWMYIHIYLYELQSYL